MHVHTTSPNRTDSEHTTIKTAEEFEGEIQAHVERLKKELGECDNIYDEQKLQYRVAALSGGIAAIKCVRWCAYNRPSVVCMEGVRPLPFNRLTKHLPSHPYTRPGSAPPPRRS